LAARSHVTGKVLPCPRVVEEDVSVVAVGPSDARLFAPPALAFANLASAQAGQPGALIGQFTGRAGAGVHRNHSTSAATRVSDRRTRPAGRGGGRAAWPSW